MLPTNDFTVDLVEEAVEEHHSTVPTLLDWQQDAENDLLDRLAHAIDKGYILRHVYNVATGAGKTEIAGSVLIKAHDRFWGNPEVHPTHGWACDRQLLYDETVIRLGDRVEAMGSPLRIAAQASQPKVQRRLLPDHINMIRPQSFVERGKEHKSHRRPIAYHHDLIQHMPDMYPWGVLVRDECHHDASDYGCSTCLAWGGHLFGFTATCWRGSDYDCLGAGFGGPEAQVGPYTSITFGPTPRELIGSLLSDLEMADISIKVDPWNLKLAVGNTDGYDLQTVSQEVGRVLSGPSIVRDWEKYRIPCLGFLPSKEMAHRAAKLFADAGHRTGVVLEETPERDRRALLNDLHEGRLDFLASVDIFGEGVNVPNVRCIGMLRPTASLARWRQFVGRGLRKRIDNSALLLFDWANNMYTNGSPLNGYEQFGLMPRAIRKGINCPECGTKCYGGSACKSCGADIPNPRVPTECPDCHQWVNWNQEFCVCGCRISWMCEDAKVMMPGGIELDVTGHHRRHWHARFGRCETTCDEAIAVAVAEHNRKQEEERAKDREKRAEERRLALIEAERLEEERRKRQAAEIQQQMDAKKRRSIQLHEEEIEEEGPKWNWVWHKQESPYWGTLEFNYIEVDILTSNETKTPYLGMIDRKSNNLLVLNHETYQIENLGQPSKLMELLDNGYKGKAVYDRMARIVQEASKMICEWGGRKVSAEPDRYLDEDLRKGFDCYAE